MRRFVVLATLALVFSACGGNDPYDFQPETKEKTCGVVTYNDPNKTDGSEPIGRYCITEAGKR